MVVNSPKSANEEHDDNIWKWGIFYYNPNDKRLMPPKRIKWMGWTVNFANPYSIAFNVVVLIGIIAVISLFKGRYIHF